MPVKLFCGTACFRVALYKGRVCFDVKWSLFTVFQSPEGIRESKLVCESEDTNPNYVDLCLPWDHMYFVYFAVARLKQ